MKPCFENCSYLALQNLLAAKWESSVRKSSGSWVEWKPSWLSGSFVLVMLVVSILCGHSAEFGIEVWSCKFDINYMAIIHISSNWTVNFQNWFLIIAYCWLALVILVREKLSLDQDADIATTSLCISLLCPVCWTLVMHLIFILLWLLSVLLWQIDKCILNQILSNAIIYFK